jgi:hypothetical protein
VDLLWTVEMVRTLDGGFFHRYDDPTPRNVRQTRPPHSSARYPVEVVSADIGRGKRPAAP